jgi:tetratricopeptide (TPR) repeat protein
LDLDQICDKAEKFLENGELNEALKAFKKIVKKNPNFWRGITGLTKTLSQLGRNEEAHEIIQASLKKDGLSTDGLLNLALIYSNMSMYQEALETLEEGLNINSKHKNILLEKANIHYLLGQLYNALKCYDLLLEITHDDVEIVEIVEKREKVIKALENKKQGKETLKQLINKAEALEAEGLFQDALKFYKEAQGYDISNPKLDKCIKNLQAKLKTKKIEEEKEKAEKFDKKLKERLKETLGPFSDESLDDLLNFSEEVRDKNEKNIEILRQMIGDEGLRKMGIKKGKNVSVHFANSPEDAARQSMNEFFGTFINNIRQRSQEELEEEQRVKEILRQGGDLYKQGKYSECIRYINFNRMLIVNKDVFTLLAQALFKRGIIGQALAKSMSALEIDPLHNPALKLKKAILNMNVDEMIEIAYQNFKLDAKHNKQYIEKSVIKEQATNWGLRQSELVQELRVNPKVYKNPFFGI